MREDTSIGLISGTGAEGRGMALRLAAAGFTLRLGSRSEEKARETVRQLNDRLGKNQIMSCDNASLIRECRIVFLTVPFVHAESVLDKHGKDLTTKHIVVDVTVPVVFEKGPRLLQLSEGSAAEFLQKRLPAEVPLVAAFKTLPAELLAELENPLDCDDFICSDSPEAAQPVLNILEHIPGVRWIEAGPLKYCRALEAMTFLAIGLNRRKKARHARFRVLGE